jgi:hypothetical protein
MGKGGATERHGMEMGKRTLQDKGEMRKTAYTASTQYRFTAVWNNLSDATEAT